MSAGERPLTLESLEALDAGARRDAVANDARGAATTLLALGDECERAAAGTPDRALRLGDSLAMIARELAAGSAEARALRATIPALAYMGRLDEALNRSDEAQAAALRRAAAGAAAQRLEPLVDEDRTDGGVAEPEVRIGVGKVW